MKDIFYNEKYKMWWPVFDHNPDGNYKTIMGGIGVIEDALCSIPGRKLCVQAGGHLGYWPNKLAEYFECVWTFEADPIVWECLNKNVDNGKIIACNSALAEKEGVATLYRGRSAGGTRIHKDGNIRVGQVTIDSLGLAVCDAIMLDIEGGEVNALLGARKTIEEFHPVIVVEELEIYARDIHELLTDFRYKKLRKIGRDAVWKIL